MAMVTPGEILDFWRDIGPSGWYRKDEATDRTITERFGAAHAEAAKGGLKHWLETAEGALAYVILLDQLSRNMFRNDPQAFAQDDLALAAAKASVARGDDAKIGPPLGEFFYLPFMHSENIDDQRRCVELFRASGNADSLKYAIIHLDIIEQFGRFPHRNPVLGRETTAEEKTFLDSGGFSG